MCAAHSPVWSGKQIEVHPLSGGLTNANFRVDIDGRPFFVRIPEESAGLLAVDRENEYYNTKAAALAGVGPQVRYYLPERQVMVLDFIVGQTMSKESLSGKGCPGRIAQSIKQLHAGPRFLKDFNMFRLTEFYLEIAREQEAAIPEGYPQRMETVKRIEEALEVHPLTTVPCNNDLLAENYIDDGERLWLIDYEYSGNNDPCFELGNTCQELEYNEYQIEQVCAAYFGEASPGMLARMKLNMIMSDVGWGLWAAIQAKISPIEYDFWGWAVERWGRAVEKMDAPQFEGWLKDVSRQVYS
jgi:thiamine kinase-like enzyme